MNEIKINRLDSTTQRGQNKENKNRHSTTTPEKEMML
jgi:hypothetical protein